MITYQKLKEEQLSEFIGLLSSMFCDPSYRRQGIAKELLRRVVAV